MNGCIYRTEENKCKKFSVGGALSFCYLDGTCDCRIPSNADRIRAMSDEGIEDWYWWMHKEMMHYTDSRVFVHDWLKAPVEDGDNGT